MEALLKQAHKNCSNNRNEVLASEKLGCFYCLEIFSPDKLEDWWEGIDKNTAICPFCSIDSVLPEHPHYPLTEEFLRKMKQFWFGDL